MDNFAQSFTVYYWDYTLKNINVWRETRSKLPGDSAKSFYSPRTDILDSTARGGPLSLHVKAAGIPLRKIRQSRFAMTTKYMRLHMGKRSRLCYDANGIKALLRR